MTMSQKRMGQRPTLMAIMKLGLTVMARAQQTSTKRTWMRTERVRNLKAVFTVPSTFSCWMAVGT